MIANLFEIKYASIEATDWPSKKGRLSALLRDEEFERRDLACFETDRHTNGNRYINDFCDIFSGELTRFAVEMGFGTIKVGAMWAVRYGLGDYHSVHNHRSSGYSGGLYLDYDSSVHTPSIHVCPWNDPALDVTFLAAPPVEEGTLVFVPSSILHYTRPNQSEKLRQIVAFDMEVR